LVLIYSTAIFLNAALLFIIEPLVAKMILPYLGGSPGVWNTSLVFYQACLLGGYAYAHYGASRLGTRRHATVHLILACAALTLLPVELPLDWMAAPGRNPVSLVLAVLTVSIGFPFLLLSAGAPLLQQWFAQGGHRAARDPYFLYAASNAGSIGGLLAYPLLLEPTLTLTKQNQLWFYAYGALLVLMALSAWQVIRPFAGEIRPVSLSGAEESAVPTGAGLSVARRLRWVIWSLIPSSLLLGVTAYITTDIASAPLFWIIPLTVYLLSFVVAFGRPAWAGTSFLAGLQAVLLIGAAATVFLGATRPAWFILPLHLAAFFTTCLISHGRLAADRPETRHLTEFYLWISVGGVAGGAFNALIAPLVFHTVIEYPLAIAAAAFIGPASTTALATPESRGRDWLLPPALVAAVLLVASAANRIALVPASNNRLLIAGVAAALFLLFVRHRLRFGVAITSLTLLSLWYPSAAGELLYADRSFFGSYRTTRQPDGERHVLFQGTTAHGMQSTEAGLSREPLAYYHRSGPAGQVLRVLAQLRPEGHIAVIGLGTGALACHGGGRQRYTFYEIDPLVEKIARDPRLFTYLSDCPPEIDVVIGDARLALAKADDRSYDLLVLDAFSSDVIPTHLLTREALELYLTKIKPDGVLLTHISNRYMDLTPVLGRLAQSLELVGYIQNDLVVAPADAAEGKSASRWVMLAHRQADMASLIADERWQPLEGANGAALWTDDFSDLIQVMRWR
jgi:hypothetical protein